MSKKPSEAWELFALMYDGTCVDIIAKHPNRPRVVSILDDLRLLLATPEEKTS